MAQQGATLQNYNNELVKYLEEMNSKRHSLAVAITNEAEEKERLEAEIARLQKQLAEVDSSLSEKQRVKNKYDAVISETQLAYNQILEGSQALLAVLRKEATSLQETLDNTESKLPSPSQ